MTQRSRTLILLACATALALIAPAPARAEDAPKWCSRTARAAHRACQAQARDDYWITVGNCLNEPDPAEREACRDSAAEEQAEALDETCPAQREARRDVCDALGEAPYAPVIDPADFLDPVATAAAPNPFLPLVPGTVRCYEGGDETITVTVTDETKEILGVTTIVVRDVVAEDGEVVEDTDDYYVQAVDGAVWYFGEIAKNFEDGELVDLEGSWTAGVDYAKPGIVMPAVPAVGDVYRQEFLLGEAEDMGEVIAIDGSAVAPAASCDGTCVVTRDYTPIEPDAVEEKYYAPGIGVILEVDLESGERVELVECDGP